MCQLLTKEENDRLKRSFLSLDRDCDGLISKQELLNGFKITYAHLSERDLLKEVDRVFSRADLDGDGFIDYSEWQISCVNKDSVLKKDRLVEAFKHFDKSGSGKISAKEIKNVLAVGSKKYGNENIWKQIIKEADEDRDGYITFPEFSKMMSQFIRASEMIDRMTLQSNLTVSSSAVGRSKPVEGTIEEVSGDTGGAQTSGEGKDLI